MGSSFGDRRGEHLPARHANHGATCPMAGKRAVELSKGVAHLLSILACPVREEVHLLLLEEFPAATLVDLESITADFFLGMSRFELILGQKTACWTVLPWKLARIADENEQGARVAAGEIMRHFDEDVAPHLPQHLARSQPGHESIVHRLTIHYLQAGSAARLELEAFISGTPRAQLPELQQLCAQFVFMPTMERIQESDHALVQMSTLRRHVVGPFVSLGLRMPEVLQLLEDGAEKSPTFFQLVSVFKHPPRIAEALGLQQHPMWQQILQTEALPGVNLKRDRRHRQVALLNHLLYSKDPETQYTRYQEARKAHRKKQASKARTMQAWLHQFQPPRIAGAAGDEVAKMLGQAALDHLSSHLVPGEFYSIPAASTVELLQTVIQPPAAKRSRIVHEADAEAGGVLQADVADWEGSMENDDLQTWCKQQTFFRVIHTTASRVKVPP